MSALITLPEQIYLDGAWRDARGGERMDVLNPATEEPMGSVPVAGVADMDQALEAAWGGWRRWQETDPWTRSRVLRRTADLIRERAEAMAEVLTDEQGKPLGEARGEVMGAADQFDWYADEARRIYGRTVESRDRDVRHLVTRRAVGPVAAFTPWNFPSLLPARKLAPALAAGCSVILKPAEEAPFSALLLARACHDAGLPAGVLSVLTGDPGAISAHLISSPVIRKVSFTGSVPVGRIIGDLCARSIKPASLELGGHSPVLVFQDADVESAAELCARARFRNNGQVCIAASRFYVHESVVERFTRRFVAVASSLRVGPGRSPGVEVGPLSNRRRLDVVRALVEDAVAQGADLVAGGKEPEGFERGFWFLPTVLTGVKSTMRVMCEEPFCPVAPIASFSSLEEGIELANSTPYGLAGYVFTRDTRTAFLATEGLDTGMVGVNHLVIAAAELPFGGLKESGFGREGGPEGMDAYTVTRYASMRLVEGSG